MNMYKISLVNYIRDKAIFKLYIFAFFILFFQSIHVWFLWGDFFKITCPLFFVAISYVNRKNNSLLYDKKHYHHIYIILFLISFLALRGSYDAGILSICKSLIGLLALYDLLILSQPVCVYIIRILTKIFSIISAISLAGWILFLLGVPLPHSNIMDPEYGYSFYNYYIFLYDYHLTLPRFCSIYLEPGYYGQLAVLILFANKMRINKITSVIFIGVLFSLSLAGYALIAIGFIFKYLGKKHIWYIIFLFITGYVFVSSVRQYNGGDNVINLLILERMGFENGKMSGYNRTGDDFDRYMDTKFMQNGTFILGHGSDFEKMKWEHGVAGYKVYIAQNGYIGLILAIFAYCLTLTRLTKTNREMRLYFILFMIVYWQAAYPFWFCYFALYVTGLAYLRTDDYDRKKKANYLCLHSYA